MQVILAIHVPYKVCHQTHHHKIHLLEYWYIFNRGKHLWIIQLLEVNHHNSGNCLQWFNFSNWETKFISLWIIYFIIPSYCVIYNTNMTLFFLFVAYISKISITTSITWRLKCILSLIIVKMLARLSLTLVEAADFLPSVLVCRLSLGLEVASVSSATSGNLAPIRCPIIKWA